MVFILRPDFVGAAGAAVDADVVDARQSSDFFPFVDVQHKLLVPKGFSRIELSHSKVFRVNRYQRIHIDIGLACETLEMNPEVLAVILDAVFVAFTVPVANKVVGLSVREGFEVDGGI